MMHFDACNIDRMSLPFVASRYKKAMHNPLLKPHRQPAIKGAGGFGGGGVAAKAGELGFTKALAQEAARSGITVNAICPGYINTEMVQAVPKDVLEKSILPQIPIGRLGEPEEIARCVIFLTSDDAGLITGATITANGGQYFT